MGYSSEMNGCGRFMKFSLFFVNFIIFIGGCIVVGLAAWALVDRVPALSKLVNDDLLTGATYVLLVGGIIVAVIAFFGCIGASREVKCMLLTYFMIVFLLFITMLIGGVLGYVFRGKIYGEIEQRMKNSLRSYHRHGITEAWDITQETFHCCGVHDYRDWNLNGLNMPESCCREIAPKQHLKCTTYTRIDPSTTYINGCLNTTQVYVQKHAVILGGAGIAVAILMFFGMIFSCALFRMIK
ncbi:CD151 antigen [Chelonus insularis]|uniref:CD151 antigen n=1 Tax=Chelonus insularis TaxID=460826 RepID=UPI0015898E7B|nr:CD151 antigen [Chelonus insularis]XP_034945681.1 CD151 antigen [Chelonus insularis]